MEAVDGCNADVGLHVPTVRVSCGVALSAGLDRTGSTASRLPRGCGRGIRFTASGTPGRAEVWHARSRSAPGRQGGPLSGVGRHSGSGVGARRVVHRGAIGLGPMANAFRAAMPAGVPFPFVPNIDPCAGDRQLQGAVRAAVVNVPLPCLPAPRQRAEAGHSPVKADQPTQALGEPVVWRSAPPDDTFIIGQVWMAASPQIGFRPRLPVGTGSQVMAASNRIVSRPVCLGTFFRLDRFLSCGREFGPLPKPSHQADSRNDFHAQLVRQSPWQDAARAGRGRGRGGRCFRALPPEDPSRGHARGNGGFD